MHLTRTSGNVGTSCFGAQADPLDSAKDPKGQSWQSQLSDSGSSAFTVTCTAFLPFLFLFFFNDFSIIFIYFFAALGLHCFVQAFSSCSERGLLFVAVLGLLIAVACCGAQALGARASVVAAYRFGSCVTGALERRFSSCGTRA